jgi:hypothetical protein
MTFLRRPTVSGVLIIATVLGILLFGAEVGVRAVDDRLVEPLDWHDWEAQAKADQIEALGAKGPIPIVAIGTSAMHFGLDPIQLRAELPGSPLVYNAALPGGIPRIMDIWTQHLVFPTLRPKLIVLGVNSTDVNDAGTQRGFFKYFDDSNAVRRLTGRSSVIEKVDYRISSLSELWRYRTLLRRPVTFVDSVRGHRPLNPGDAIKAFGLDVSRRRRVVDASPEKVQQFVDRRRNSWLRNYTIGGGESAALRRMVERARDAGMKVVIVEMPIGDYYLRAHPNGEQDYERFRQEIATLVQETGSSFLDASRSVTPTPDFFSDFVHLNGKGAKVFTTYLASELRKLGLA